MSGTPCIFCGLGGVAWDALAGAQYLLCRPRQRHHLAAGRGRGGTRMQSGPGSGHHYGGIAGRVGKVTRHQWWRWKTCALLLNDDL